jgi:hypothetical protein
VGGVVDDCEDKVSANVSDSGASAVVLANEIAAVVDTSEAALRVGFSKDGFAVRVACTLEIQARPAIAPSATN